jgi:DNA-binding NtrC family response regulator
LGSTRAVAIDVRIVAATNRNLQSEVQAGSFRQDLYYLLAAAFVCLPPLRERMSDLPLLVEHFLALESPPRNVAEVRPEVWQLLAAHHWPGNVRELRNAVQRLLLTPGRPFGATLSAPQELADRAAVELRPLRLARREASDAFERSYMAALLTKTNGRVGAAARVAEVSRQMLNKLMRKHAIGSSSTEIEDDPAESSNDPM